MGFHPHKIWKLAKTYIITLKVERDQEYLRTKLFFIKIKSCSLTNYKTLNHFAQHTNVNFLLFSNN